MPREEYGDFFCVWLHAHAGGHPEGGGNGGQHGNYDVQDFAPEFFFHDLFKW